jgi:hypothetical protein
VTLSKKKQRGKAHRGLALIQKLYRIEKQARKLKPEERHRHRQQHVRPILNELRAWLDKALPQVPPMSAKRSFLRTDSALRLEPAEGNGMGYAKSQRIPLTLTKCPYKDPCNGMQIAAE